MSAAARLAARVAMRPGAAQDAILRDARQRAGGQCECGAGSFMPKRTFLHETALGG